MLLRLLEKKEKRKKQKPRQGGLDGDRRDKGRKRKEKREKKREGKKKLKKEGNDIGTWLFTVVLFAMLMTNRTQIHINKLLIEKVIVKHIKIVLDNHINMAMNK